MKRSSINQYQRAAFALMEQYRFLLPEWATWGLDRWAIEPELRDYVSRHQMGWDITDFGSGDFARCGLVLLCLRNGAADDPVQDAKPYAEKIMVVQEDQETPCHLHRVKMEDIINRGGGVLCLQFWAAQPRVGTIWERLEEPAEHVSVRVDGRMHTLQPGETLELRPGQSVTVPRGTYHRFFGKPGCGPVLVGEVSQVNDDHGDNMFFSGQSRFSGVEEDEGLYWPLWNELASLPHSGRTP